MAYRDKKPELMVVGETTPPEEKARIETIVGAVGWNVMFFGHPETAFTHLSARWVDAVLVEDQEIRQAGNTFFGNVIKRAINRGSQPEPGTAYYVERIKRQAIEIGLPISTLVAQPGAEIDAGGLCLVATPEGKVRKLSDWIVEPPVPTGAGGAAPNLRLVS